MTSPSPSGPAARQQRAARSTAARPTVRSTTPDGDLTTRRPPPDVWRAALELADGDARRIEVGPDGSVTVTNHRIR